MFASYFMTIPIKLSCVESTKSFIGKKNQNIKTHKVIMSKENFLSLKKGNKADMCQDRNTSTTNLQYELPGTNSCHGSSLIDSQH